MKAIITGASSGIGEQMAYYLDKKGFDLILVARDINKLENVKNSLSSSTQIVAMDLANKENCQELFAKFPDVDILINNAGFGAFGNFSETNLDTELEMIHTNIVAVHVLTKLYLKQMMEKNSGYILNVGSIASFLPGPLMATYYSTKAYVLRLTQAIQEELNKKNSHVHVSCLCPGPVKTEFLKKAGVKFKTQSATSEYVAQYAIDQMLKNKKIIVPTFKIKFAKFGTKLCPDKILAKIAYKIQESRK